MIRRTPQEIADFFGCYVAETESGFWFMIRHKPSLENGEWITRCGLPYDIDSNIVEAPADHDWTHLYEPQPGDWRLLDFTPGARNHIDMET